MPDVIMTNYDLNKQAYATLPSLKEQDLKEKLTNLGAWLSLKFKTRYFMLLCRERNDYTIIRIDNCNFNKAILEIKEILESRGEIIDISYRHGLDSYECWVRERRTDSIQNIEEELGYEWTPQVWMFLFFEADDFVVEVE